MEPKTYSDLFHRVCKKAGVVDVSFHCTRHTFATRALENGMDVKVLAYILGHAQASTTLNMYGHALPDHKMESMKKMRDTYISRNAIMGDISVVSDEMPTNEKTAKDIGCKVVYFSPNLKNALGNS